MVYYNMKSYKLVGFRKSNRTGKKYDGIIENKTTKKKSYIPFGALGYENYHDKTDLNLYPNLIHGDKKRRKSYKARHVRHLKVNFFSPSYFSFYYLW